MKELSEHVVHLERLVYMGLALNCLTILMVVLTAIGGLAAGAVALAIVLTCAVVAGALFVRGYRLKAQFTIEHPPQVHIYESSRQTEVESL